MIRDAVVASAPGGPAQVAGMPVALRTILVLQRAGIERVMLEGGEPPTDPRIRVAVARGVLPAATPHVAIGPGAVVDQVLVQAAMGANAPGRLEREGVWVEVRRDGVPVTPPAWPGILLSAQSPGVERTLLRGLENPRDGYLDRLIHRRFSRPLTALLLSTPLTPNQVTILGVVIGILGGLFVGAASTWEVLAGIGLLLLSGVLDCCDGEIARIKLTESKLGHVLDVTGDTLVHAALLGGIATRLGASGVRPDRMTLGLLALGVLGSFAAITWSEVTESRRHTVAGAWENRILENVLSPLTTRDWYVFPAGFALAGRLDALVGAAAWGAQIFWVAVVALVFRVIRRT